MARIIYTALVESIRGSIKGTTFQRNAYGHTVKAKPNMVNPNSTAQNFRKARFGAQIGLWKELSDTERADWNTYANTYPVPTRKNPTSYLNGFNAFGRWHAVTGLYNLGGLLVNPTGPQGTIGVYQFDLVLSGGNLFVSTDLLPSEGPWVLIVSLTRPLTATQRFLKSWTRLITAFTLTGADDVNISANYIPFFGVIPSVGDLIGVRLIIQNTTNGQVSFETPTIQAIVT